MAKKKDDKNVIDFPHTFKIKFPNAVLLEPKPDGNQEDFFEEIEETYPDLEKRIEDPDVLDRLSKICRVCSAEKRMGTFQNNLAAMLWEIVPELTKSDIDIYFMYRKRVFLICWHCLCVWSHIVKNEESLPENFGICPNGCNRLVSQKIKHRRV
jgi:hypothetical protein